MLCQNNSVHCYRNVRETQWTPQQSKSPWLVTDLQINLRICQHAFKFLPDTVLNKNSWDTNRCFFSFSCSPCPSQSCLSRFSHQILYTNIEGTTRHKSVPTILLSNLNAVEEYPIAFLYLNILETCLYQRSIFCTNYVNSPDKWNHRQTKACWDKIT